MTASSWMKLGDSQDCTVVDPDKDPTAGLPSTTLVPLATGVGRPAVGVAATTIYCMNSQTAAQSESTTSGSPLSAS
jgi:hypothetical protein